MADPELANWRPDEEKNRRDNVSPQLQQMMESAAEERARKCMKKIKKVLASFDCVLVPQVSIFGAQIQSVVHVRPNQRIVQPQGGIVRPQ